MADKEVPLSEQKQLTWKEKIDQGKPLNPRDDVKADADFNYKRRLREEEERKEFEKLKAEGRPSTDMVSDDDTQGANDGKKGK